VNAVLHAEERNIQRRRRAVNVGGVLVLNNPSLI